MKQEIIKTVIKEKVDKIADLCENIWPDFDKEIIHEFRVTVKKLRSFLRLLRMHSHKQSIKIPKKFKRLYQIAGTIRDAQLELEKVSSSKVVLPEYLNKLQHVLNTQKKEWHKHYHKKVVHKLENKLLSLNYETLHPAILENFLRTKLASVNTISQIASPTDDQVHRIRKEIKDILYTWKLTGKEWKAAKKEFKIIPVTQLDDIADTVGNYNDRRITLEHIKSFASPKMNAQETDTIKKISGKEKLRLEKEKKNILVKVKKLISSINENE